VEKRKILLGITGGIAAYKSAELVRMFVKRDFEVRVIMTKASREFITPLTLETLSGNEVSVEMFPKNKHFSTHHIDLADWADIFIIAPSTANFLGKASSGICDDLLSTVFAAAGCPILIAPAMNSNMWDYPAVRENVRKLESFGFYFIGPETGDLACGWIGRGRMAEPSEIYETALSILSANGELRGIKMLITASRTEEPIDAVRYISNRSSGKMGYALAIEALALGAEVKLIAGPSELPNPRGVEVIKVNTAAEMASGVRGNFDECDVLIMAAAVADYTPVEPSEGKIKKLGDDLNLRLKPTEDILSSLALHKADKVIIGFALETENGLINARKKLAAKNLDFIVLNNPKESGAGFNIDTNRVDFIYADGKIESLPLMSKRRLAQEILKRVSAILKSKAGRE